MRGIKSSVISILAIGLIASSAFGVTAKGEGISSFTVEIAGPPLEVSFDEATGLERLVFETQASDPRAEGVLTLAAARNGAEEGDFRYTVSREGVRLASDGGDWVGTVLSVDARDMAAETSRGGGLFELIGEGDYEGLSMILTAAPEQELQGLIIPTELVPEQPQPPME